MYSVSLSGPKSREQISIRYTEQFSSQMDKILAFSPLHVLPCHVVTQVFAKYIT